MVKDSREKLLWNTEIFAIVKGKTENGEDDQKVERTSKNKIKMKSTTTGWMQFTVNNKILTNKELQQ